MKVHATLRRIFEKNGASIGTLVVKRGAVTYAPLWTLELPWRGNQPNVSCIPQGLYDVVPHGWNGEAVKYKQVYRVLDVPDRSGILFHAGNIPADTQGCILVGLGLSKADGHIVESRAAVEQLRKWIGKEGFTLEVFNEFG